MKLATKLVAVVATVVVFAIVGIVGWVLWDRVQTDRRQDTLAGFYTAPDPLPDAAPGALIRHEPLTEGVDLPGGSAHRILYLTETADGTLRVSGGQVFIPDGTPPPGGRPVISWAHPTTGMGDACAPSRTTHPTGLLEWLPAMMDLGWVVVATDYSGLGTEGTQAYLIAAAEVHDVVNAVRAAGQFPRAGASSTYGVFGHSQGGHAALWAATLAPQYAPELNLVGVAGAAPAAPLTGLVADVWDTELAWVIGAEVMVSYPAHYEGLDPADVLTSAALGAYENLAEDCLTAAGLEAKIRQEFGQRFFASNPLDNPAWKAAIADQDAPPAPPDIPVLVTQSVNDGVVYSEPIAAMTSEWCDAGSTITTVWLGPLRGTQGTPNLLTHMVEGAVGGSVATTWFEDRFAGEPASNSCSQKPPLVPAATPVG